MSTLNTVMTVKGRESMAKARAGLITLPTITGMAFGDGGADASGTPIAPSASATALTNELFRKANTSTAALSDTTIRYSCKLAASELVGASISEIGLYDSDGDLVCIKTFIPKGKDADMELTFTIDDAF